MSFVGNQRVDVALCCSSNRWTMIKKIPLIYWSYCLYCLAGGLGFEPRLAESESAVLPLDDPPPGRYVAYGPLPRRASGPRFAPRRSSRVSARLARLSRARWRRRIEWSVL